MQHQLFEVLQQGAACTVHDALRQAGGAGGVEDIERVIEWQLHEGNLLRGMFGDKFWPRDSACKRAQVGCLTDVGHDDDLMDADDAVGNVFGAGERIVRLALEPISVGGKQQLGFDLTEAFDRAVDTEVRRTGRPRCAKAGAGEHGDDGLGHVGHKTGDTITGLDAVLFERGGQPRDLVVELAIAECALALVFAPKDDGGLFVATA